MLKVGYLKKKKVKVAANYLVITSARGDNVVYLSDRWQNNKIYKQILIKFKGMLMMGQGRDDLFCLMFWILEAP